MRNLLKQFPGGVVHIWRKVVHAIQNYSPMTSRIVQSSNVIWLGRMYYTRQNASLTQQLPIMTVLLSVHDTSDDAEIQKLEVATMPLFEERGGTNKSSLEKTEQNNLEN